MYQVMHDVVSLGEFSHTLWTRLKNKTTIKKKILKKKKRNCLKVKECIFKILFPVKKCVYAVVSVTVRLAFCLWEIYCTFLDYIMLKFR